MVITRWLIEKTDKSNLYESQLQSKNVIMSQTARSPVVFPSALLVGPDTGNLEVFASIEPIAQIPERILFRKEHNVVMSEQ